MKFRKLSLTLLTLGFCTTLAGGALAVDTNTTPTTPNVPPTTVTTTTDGTTTTAPTVEVTAPKVRTFPGTIKAIDIAGKKILVIGANKKVTKEIALDEKTTFVHKGKAIDPAKIGAGSRVEITVQITGVKGEEVFKAVKVHVNTLTEKKKPVKKQPVKKPVKKEPVRKEPVKKEPVKKEPAKDTKTPERDNKAPNKDNKTPERDTKVPNKDTQNPIRDIKAPGQGNNKSPKK